MIHLAPGDNSCVAITNLNSRSSEMKCGKRGAASGIGRDRRAQQIQVVRDTVGHHGRITSE